MLFLSDFDLALLLQGEHTRYLFLSLRYQVGIAQLASDILSTQIKQLLPFIGKFVRQFRV